MPKKRTYTEAQRLNRNAARRAFRAKHGDRINRARRESYAASEGKRETAWAGNLRQKYGLSLDDYGRLMESQSGRCAICRREMADRREHSGRRASVDHHHGTGLIRGLLCHRCNMFVGLLENIALRDAAMRYLAEHEETRKT